LKNVANNQGLLTVLIHTDAIYIKIQVVDPKLHDSHSNHNSVYVYWGQTGYKLHIFSPPF